MLEAARLGQWQADAQSVAELKTRYNDLAQRFAVRSDNTAFGQFVAPGFGLSAGAPSTPTPQPTATTKPGAAQAHAPEAVAAQRAPQIKGLKLERQTAASPAPPDVVSALAALLAMAMALAGGAWRAGRQGMPPHRCAAPLQPAWSN